jgi:hypothetical protein
MKHILIALGLLASHAVFAAEQPRAGYVKILETTRDAATSRNVKCLPNCPGLPEITEGQGPTNKYECGGEMRSAWLAGRIQRTFFILVKNDCTVQLDANGKPTIYRPTAYEP